MIVLNNDFESPDDLDILTCEKCGEEFPEDQMTNYGGEWFCESCLELELKG